MLISRAVKQSLSRRWTKACALSTDKLPVHVNQIREHSFYQGSLPKVKVFHRGNPRAFNNTPIVYNEENEDALPPLSELIQQELEAEENLKTSEMPNDLSGLHDNDIDPHWRLEDKQDSSQIRLFRREPTKNNSKVILSFHCQDTIPQDSSLLDGFMTEDGQEENVDEDSNKGEEDSDPIRFTVTVAREGKSLLFSCISEEATVNIESIMIKEGEEVHGIDYTDASNSHLYQGPQFEELEQDLQDGFHDFLKDDCGVGEDIAAFVSMYADYKEQTMYMNWLKGTLSMVN